MARREKTRKMNKRKNNHYKWSIICLVVILVMGCIYLETLYGGGKIQQVVTSIISKEEDKQTTTVAENTITIGENTSTQIIPFGEKFLLTTKDGVKYYNSIGDQKWSDTFTMTNPSTVYEGEYVAIGDMNGRSIRVYNQERLVYALQLEGSPIQFELNENGYLSVIFQAQDTYYVSVYNANGVLLKGRVETTTGIYPMFSDVSDDNKSFCVAYLDTTDMKMVSKVLFFYINPEDSEAYTDSIFAGVEMIGEVVSRVKYMEDDMLIAVSDTTIYGLTTTGRESWSMALQNWLTLCDLSNKGYVTLVLGSVMPNAEGDEAGTVLCINTSGKEKGRYQMDGVEYLRASDKGVVVGDGNTYIGMTYKGSVEWQHQVAGTVKDVLTLSSLNRVMVVSTLQGAIYTLRGAMIQEGLETSTTSIEDVDLETTEETVETTEEESETVEE